jgi:hypothetical protein
VSREALFQAITRFQRGELSLEDLQETVAAEGRTAGGELGVELRSLGATLESISLGICKSDRRGAALEQLEPAVRLIQTKF